MATGSAVPVVAATQFAGAFTVQTWVRGPGGWVAGPRLLPSGDGLSYDAAAAVLADGESLLAFGAAPGGSCIAGGQVALARVSAAGVVSAPVVINAPPAGFDDRPTVAAGSGGNVWVGWSRGVPGEQCEPVGESDVIQVAASTDGGHSFGPVRTLPRVTGGAAFGVRIAVAADGSAVVSWVESTAKASSLVVARVGPHGVLVPPRVVDTGPVAPLVLPDSSFYAFTTAGMALLPDGRVALAWPRWDGTSSGLRVLVGRVSGSFTAVSVPTPPAADVLMPDVAVAGQNALWCLYAVHRRAGDALGYQLAQLATGSGELRLTGVQAVAAGTTGPGYYELGEESQLSRWSGRLRTAVVLAGAGGSSVMWWQWPLPAAAASSPSPSPPPPPSAAAPSPSPAPRAHSSQTLPWTAIGAGVSVFALLGAAVARRRAVVRRRARVRRPRR